LIEFSPRYQQAIKARAGATIKEIRRITKTQKTEVKILTTNVLVVVGKASQVTTSATIAVN
jgi:hypothetical protein